MPCVHGCAGHATRCMLERRGIDGVWCTSMRRFVRRVKRLRTECGESGSSARLTLSRLDTVALQLGTAGATAIFGVRPPNPATDEEGGKEKRDFYGRSGSVSGSLDVLGFPHSVRHGLSQTGLSPHRTLLSTHCAHHSLCACSPLRAISARAWVHLGDGLRRAISAVP